MDSKKSFFDSNFKESEQFPTYFTISFKEIGDKKNPQVKVIFNRSEQIGDVINDNSYKNDFYRYHDIFHYSFAALLGWSPCTRAMMKRKRKSNKLLDEIEDGARAAIIEESLSMIIFNEAKKKNYFKDTTRVSKTTLRIIKEMTENFEVNVKTTKEWKQAILKAYEAFRFLIENKGGTVEFNTLNKEINYTSLN